MTEEKNRTSRRVMIGTTDVHRCESGRLEKRVELEIEKRDIVIAQERLDEAVKLDFTSGKDELGRDLTAQEYLPASKPATKLYDPKLDPLVYDETPDSEIGLLDPGDLRILNGMPLYGSVDID